MIECANFNFGKVEADLNGSLRFWVPKQISSKADIFRAYAVGMKAPQQYFGNDWSAFEDCLLDLSWLEVTDIAIIHGDLTDLPEENLKLYLSILSNAVALWNSAGTTRLAEQFSDFCPHRMSVYFPKDTEPELKELLQRDR